MNAITIPAELVTEQIPDCKPGESITVTGTFGAADAAGNYKLEGGVLTRAEPVEEVEPVVEEEVPMSPAAKAVMAKK